MDVVDDQIKAYNARDLGGFIATYSLDAIIEDGEGNLLANGQADMREKFGAIFATNPESHCRVLHQIHVGKYAVYEEEISGVKAEPAPRHRIVIYRVERNKIAHVRTLR